MFGGYDTAASTLNWATFLIGSNPSAQARVQEELQEIFGTDKGSHVTSADLNKLKYLECCIKEALRLYPSIPMIGRVVTKDLELDSETILPAGVSAFIMPYLVHRDETYFPDPNKFLPERFFPENSKGRHPFAYIPFSGGPRNCIGQRFAMMEAKVLLANLFRNFVVEPTEREEDLIVLAEVVLRPKHGIRVKLTPKIN